MNPVILATSHALAMTVAALLALALAGCGSESPAELTRAAPEVAAGSHETVSPVVRSDLDLGAGTESAEPVIEPVIESEEPGVEADGAEVREADASQIEVRRIIPTTAIENREPVEERETFDFEELEHNGRVYAFFDVRNSADVDAHLNVVFISPRGQAHGQVELTVPAGARRWRTWAYTRALAEGTWDVELRSADGTVLAERRFEVQQMF